MTAQLMLRSGFKVGRTVTTQRLPPTRPISAMAESSAFLMIDDSNQDIVYGNDNWVVFSDAHWYKESGTFAKNASSASMTYSFNGE